MTSTALSPSPPAIASWWSDPLLVGGLSLVVMIPLFFVDDALASVLGGELLVVNLLVNWPHFMASYRLLYGSREMMRAHKAAAFYVPLALVTYITTCFLFWDVAGLAFEVLVLVGTGYTAWHYAGQTWGMMASFAHLGGVPFDARERKLLRASIVVMAVWLGALWWTRAPMGFLVDESRDDVRGVLALVAPISVVGLALGILGFFSIRRRTGRLPPLNVLVAWLSLQVWLAVIARHPWATFLVQSAHSLQYMPFVARVEANRAKSRPLARLAVWALVLVVAGHVVFRVLAGALQDVALAVSSPKSLVLAIPLAVTVFVNVHHYFTDGVLWKLRNPEVRRDLFKHLGAR